MRTRRKLRSRAMPSGARINPLVLPYTPRDLFLSGNDGAWYDPLDYSTAFQDIAGTDPVITTGQTVGMVLPKAGGTVPLIATADGNRPASSALGFNTAGSKFMVADALSDILEPAGADWSFSAVIKHSAGLGGTLFSAGQSTVSTQHYYMTLLENTQRSIARSVSLSPTVTSTPQAAALRANTKMVLTINCDGTALDYWVNGTKVLTGLTYSPAVKVLDQFTIAALRVNATSQFGTAEYGDIVFIDRDLTDDEIAIHHIYCADKHGIVLAPSDTVDAFIVLGQSNAEGRGTGGPAVAAGTAWDMFGAGTRVLVDPVGSGISTGSAWPAFANKYYELTGRKCAIIECATGATSVIPAASSGNANWTSTANNAPRTGTVNGVTDALTALNDRGILGHVRALWCQGESDGEAYNGTTVTDTLYEAGLDDCFTYLKTQIPSLEGFLISELGAPDDGVNEANWALIRAAQAAVDTARADTVMAFTGAKNFPGAGKMVDRLHYNQTGLNEMGEAFATAAAALL